MEKLEGQTFCYLHCACFEAGSDIRLTFFHDHGDNNNSWDDDVFYISTNLFLIRPFRPFSSFKETILENRIFQYIGYIFNKEARFHAILLEKREQEKLREFLIEFLGDDVSNIPFGIDKVSIPSQDNYLYFEHDDTHQDLHPLVYVWPKIKQWQFIKRICKGFKQLILGEPCRYGHVDEFIANRDLAKQLLGFLNKK